MTTKICTACLQEKDLLEFRTNNYAKDGRTAQCKVCILAYNSASPEYQGYQKGYRAGSSSMSKKEYKVLEAALRHVLVEQYLEQEDKIVECLESFGDYLHGKCYFGADFDPRDKTNCKAPKAA